MKTLGLLCNYCGNYVFHSVHLFPFYVSMHPKIKHRPILCTINCLNSLLIITVSSVLSSHSELKPWIQYESSSLGPASVREGSLGFLLWSEFSLSLRNPCSHLLFELNLEILVTAEVDRFSLWPCPSWQEVILHFGEAEYHILHKAS